MKLQTAVRQFTGDPFRHRAYIVSRDTGAIVFACGHNHRRRKNPDGSYTSGAFYAQRCAERALRRWERADAAVTGESDA